LWDERGVDYQPLQKTKSLKHEPQRRKETKKSSSFVPLCLRGKKKAISNLGFIVFVACVSYTYVDSIIIFVK
jgi:hypothetical protein